MPDYLVADYEAHIAECEQPDRDARNEILCAWIVEHEFDLCKEVGFLNLI
jgi:hypothetical protein